MLFIDDDTFLNPKLLVSYLKNNVTKEMEEVLYAGRVVSRYPQRVKHMKWYLTTEEYPLNTFPPFVAANFLLLSQKSLKTIYSVSNQFKMFFMDDAFLGVLAYKCEIKPVNLPNVIGYLPLLLPYKMYDERVLGFHGFLGVSSNEMVDIWAAVGDSIRFKAEYFK